jgi:iron complex outermembrane receptor protein
MFHRTKICGAVALAFGPLLAGAALAQDATPEAATNVQRVEITGSAIKRIAMEGALPIQTISKDDIKKSGVTTVTDLIQNLPAMQGFTSATQSVNGGGGGVTTASIHDLGSQYTLVLLNGHRMASYTTSSEVNLNQIPLSAIDHVDVLTDGASALYGADAIAGVVNIITKKDTTDGALDLSMDHPFKSGGQSASASISKGFGDLAKDRFNVFLAASFQHQSALTASQRSFSKNGGIFNFKDAHGNESLAVDSSYAPAANVYADLTKDGDTSPSDSLFYNPSLSANGSCTAANTVQTSDGRCKYNYAAAADDIPASRQANFLATGRFNLNDKVSLWAETLFGSTRTDARYAAPAQAFSLSDAQIAQYVTPLVPSGYTSSDEVGYLRMLGTGGRKDGYLTRTQHMVVGADVTTGNWDSTFSFTHSQSHLYDIAEGGYSSANAINALMDSGKFDPFSGDAQTDVLQSAVLHQTLDQSRSTLDVLSAHTSTALAHLEGGDLGFATGIDLSRQKFTDRPSAILMGANALQPDYTDTLFGGSSGTLPFDSARNSWGVFTELNAPITKRLEIDASARFDSYGAIHNKDGFDASGAFIGSETQGKKNQSTTFKLSSSYRPVDQLLMRGSFGTGFRVPTIGNVSSPLEFFGVTGEETCSANAPTNLSTYCRSGPFEYNEQAGGNPATGAGALKPEKSDQWTLGFRFEPSAAFSFGADLWTVRVHDQINTISETTAFKDMATYSSLFSVINDPATGVPTLTFLSQPLNTGNAFYQGVDFDGESHVATPIGRLTTKGHVTWMTRADYQQPGLPGYVNDMNKVGVDGQVTFRYQVNMSTSLQQGAFTHTVAFNFKPGYKDDYTDYCFDTASGFSGDASQCSADSANRRVSSYATFDFQEKYDVNKSLSFTAGIKNVFNRNPPFSLIDQLQVGNSRGYDSRYTNALGRTFAATASYRF